MISVVLTVLLSLVSSAAALRAQSPGQAESVRLLVRGAVTTPGGYRISHVAIRIQGADIEAESGPDGSFELRGLLPPNLDRSMIEVWAAYSGFEPVIELVDLRTVPIELNIELRLQRSRERVTVEAQAPPPEGTREKMSVGFLDIVSTAGTSADPFFAAQMLPGVAKVDEGGGLFVRGGDVSETATYLDRSLFDHPFRNETPTGGFFGTIDIFQIEGFSLTTGGFPARYGNVLSGVLELNSRGAPPRRNLQFNLGLASASFQVSQPLGEGRAVRLAANRVMTQALVALNGTDFEFTRPPSGWDTNLNYFQSLGDLGSLRFGILNQESSVGSQLEETNFDGFLDSSNRNQVAVLSWEKELGWQGEVAATLTHSRHRNRTEIGALDIDGREDVFRFRLDYRYELKPATLRAGLEWESIDNRSIGTLPRVGTDFTGRQGVRLWDQRVLQKRRGGYLELERAFGPFLVNAGLRFDSFKQPTEKSLEPRFSMTYQLRPGHRFRFAAGLYRQAPASEYLNPQVGNPHLGLLSARHWILGYRFGEEDGPLFLRVEGYWKNYRNLPLEDLQLRFSDRGSGQARGLDLFLSLKRDGWESWMSYSFLSAHRLYTPWQRRGQFEIPKAAYQPDFAVPHTFQLSFKKRLLQALDASATLRLASGVPFTPVVGTRSFSNGTIPVYGPINSQRVPHYQRLDLSFSHPVQLFNEALTLVYVGINDVLDRRNFYRYVYSEDFQDRRPAATSFGRAFYFGITFNR